MRTKYVIEIYNKYSDDFVEQIDVFETYEETKEFIKNTDIDIDKDGKYFEITEIEYDDEENEINRVGLVAE